mmetsp:Transcript_79523/g.170442  ORF Transcript_79523/g.170442 Transcript_79523/m.170442 type:complete len:643 (-) Transcript_79523:187-2115(-)
MAPKKAVDPKKVTNDNYKTLGSPSGGSTIEIFWEDCGEWLPVKLVSLEEGKINIRRFGEKEEIEAFTIQDARESVMKPEEILMGEKELREVAQLARSDWTEYDIDPVVWKLQGVGIFNAQQLLDALQSEKKDSLSPKGLRQRLVFRNKRLFMTKTLRRLQKCAEYKLGLSLTSSPQKKAGAKAKAKPAAPPPPGRELQAVPEPPPMETRRVRAQEAAPADVDEESAPPRQLSFADKVNAEIEDGDTPSPQRPSQRPPSRFSNRSKVVMDGEDSDSDRPGRPASRFSGTGKGEILQRPSRMASQRAKAFSQSVQVAKEDQECLSETVKAAERSIRRPVEHLEAQLDSTGPAEAVSLPLHGANRVSNLQESRVVSEARPDNEEDVLDELEEAKVTTVQGVPNKVAEATSFSIKIGAPLRSDADEGTVSSAKNQSTESGSSPESEASDAGEEMQAEDEAPVEDFFKVAAKEAAAAEEARALRAVACNEGHILKKGPAPYETDCDECSLEFTANCVMWRCAECTFDICPACYTMRSAAVTDTFAQGFAPPPRTPVNRGAPDVGGDPTEVPVAVPAPASVLAQPAILQEAQVQAFCNKRHRLTLEPAPYDVDCNSCDKELDQGVKVWRCGMCQFDLCSDCYDKRVGI